MFGVFLVIVFFGCFDLLLVGVVVFDLFFLVDFIAVFLYFFWVWSGCFVGVGFVVAGVGMFGFVGVGWLGVLVYVGLGCGCGV